MRTIPAVLLALLAALLLASCGGDDNGDSGDGEAELTAQPEAEEPIADVLDPFNAAIEAQSCEEFLALAHSSARPEGDTEAEPTAEECEFAEPLLRDLRGAEFTESEEFGTAAVTESAAPPAMERDGDAVAFIWALDADGSYGHVTLFVGDEQVGVEPAGDPMPNAEAFVQAVQDEDCKAMVATLNKGGALVGSFDGDARAACEAVLDGDFFAPAIAATPEPQLESLGGTLDTTFVGVATQEDYFTLQLGTPPADPDAEQKTEMLIDGVFRNTDNAEPPQEPSPEEEANAEAAEE